MNALLQLMIVALMAGTAPAPPSTPELGGCHKRVTVPGFSDRLVLVMKDGELLDPGAELSQVQTGDMSEAWVGLSCWAPVSERFVHYDDDEAGIGLLMIVSAAPYVPLQTLLKDFAQAQERHMEETGSFASSAAELGIAGPELMDAWITQEDGWSIAVGNEMLQCTLTAKMLASYRGQTRGIGSCIPTDDERWVRPLREFWQAQTAEVGRAANDHAPTRESR